MRNKDITIPKREHIIEIDKNDPLRYYYIPVVRTLYRQKMKLATDLIGDRHYSSLAEIGYGSGIFLPEIAKHCDKVFGVDLHQDIPKVKQMLASEGTDAVLFVGDILTLPIKEKTFSAVISLSLLEHIRQLDTAVKEIHRILEDGGVAILGFPPKNKVMTALFRFIGFANIDDHHVSDAEDILKVVDHYFEIEEVRRISFLPGKGLSIYTVCKARKTGEK